MCFFDHSLAHIFFVFHFVAKPMLEFRENMMFFRTVLKSSNYIYLSRRKVLFSRTGSNDGFSAAWCLSIVSQAPVVRKPINANPRLNRPNPRSKFILRLNSVPQRPISTIQE